MGRSCRAAIASVAIALLAGCGGSPPPIAAPGMMPQSRAILASVGRSGSWMLPVAKSEDLLYVSDFYGVHIFSYPKGLPVGNIYGFASPAGLCSDQDGNIFVTDTPTYHVYEYAHGGTTLLKTLYDNYVDFGPIDCSVDPRTGNVAVSSADSRFVVVFPKAKEEPKVYYDDVLHVDMYRCAYDDNGDLFVDQVYNRRHNYIGELPKGATKFTNYVLDQRIDHPGGIQFSGKHVAIEDLKTHVVYRPRFFGSKATIVGSTSLDGTTWVEQSWIKGGTLIGPDSNGTVYLWKYPGGGSPASSIAGFTLNVGSTVSLAPN